MAAPITTDSVSKELENRVLAVLYWKAKHIAKNPNESTQLQRGARWTS